jgi:hypothetical protein
MSSLRSKNETRISPDAAEAVAAVILGSYRRADFADPDAFVSATAAVLGQFSEPVVRQAFDPRSGLQTQQKWPPTVAEVRDACERVLAEQQNRERRAYLSEHRVIIDTPRGPMSEPDAERLRLGKPVHGIASHLRISGPSGDDADPVERALRHLYVLMSKADRLAKIVRPVGTTRARVDIENAIRKHLGDRPDVLRSTCRLLADNPEIYHEAAERQRVHGDGWSVLTLRIHEHHSGLPQGPLPDPMTRSDFKSTRQDVRDSQVAEWDRDIRPTMKRSAYSRPDEPPPGLTDADRQAWYDRRLETLRGQPAAKLSEAALQIMSRGSLDRGGHADDAGAFREAAE